MNRSNWLYYWSKLQLPIKLEHEFNTIKGCGNEVSVHFLDDDFEDKDKLGGVGLIWLCDDEEIIIIYFSDGVY